MTRLPGYGYPHRSCRERTLVHPVPGFEEVLGGSTWQSLSRGTGNVETDYLNGELVRIARQHGLTAPINARLATLTRRAARAGQQPGELRVGELAELLGLNGRRQ